MFLSTVTAIAANKYYLFVPLYEQTLRTPVQVPASTNANMVRYIDILAGLFTVFVQTIVSTTGYTVVAFVKLTHLIVSAVDYTIIREPN